MASRAGRRPGRPDTREAILTAARHVFVDKGYDSASVRAIATHAGVDPALVHHYFGTKDRLFLACVSVPFDPAQVMPQILDAPREEIGSVLVRVVLTLWDSPAGAGAAALLGSSLSNEWIAKLLREFVTTQILRQVIGHLGLDEQEAPHRAALAATQIIGLAVIRYVLKLEPVASAPAERLVAAAGPVVQRYLTGDLPGAWPERAKLLPPDGHRPRHPRGPA
ncbi:TetR/AcrR family transcriptional regulator [Nonomuraea sp. PA05]|uniref:TetR/AcrR family transcriptional regulator n=1 Tax=Nonomuraea sp. PA05 TaxID=2604466 RepID=UPI0011D58B3B|nr:TetR family transcriptional regulator [Nonomuraea sp. PA05]TYB56128.1 TetR/AcrR family transcriptional regulator [Nonomuraea sp. PA05]